MPIQIALQKPSSFTILLVVTVIVLGWLLFSRGCAGSPAAVSSTSGYIDSFKAEKSVSKKRGDSLKEMRLKDAYSNEVIEEVGALYAQADSVVQSQKVQINNLQSRYMIAKAAKDTPAQLKNCDTIVGQLAMWQKKYDDADQLADQYVSKTSAELYQKQTIIDMQGRQISSLQRQTDVIDSVLKKFPVRPPLLRGYLGVGAGLGMYNNFGPELHILTRKDVMYTAGIKFGLGGLTYEAGVSKLISFKKK